MNKLYLKFADESGERKRIEVAGKTFVIGRHSENDLSIVDANISRRHLEIENFEDGFLAADLHSSNGTTRNGAKLSTAEYLQNGDKLNLGGTFEIEIELLSENAAEPTFGPENPGAQSFDQSASTGTAAAAEAGAGKEAAAGSGGTSDAAASGLGFFFILAPVLGLLVLLSVVGAVFLFSGGSGKNSEAAEERAGQDEFIFTSDEDGDFLKNVPSNLSDDEEEDSEKPGNADAATRDSGSLAPDISSEENSANELPASSEVETVSAPSAELSETDKIREEAIGFMRRIAHEDPRPVVTTRQLSVVNAKIRQYENSAALARNIENARAGAAQIESLARSKNLKPQFLANAALTKLGNQTGDVVATAQGMLDVLQNLSVQIGTGLANESLIVIAAYNQGVADKNLRMRDALARLSKDNPSVSSRQVRTIWFLRDKAAVSDAEFELALRFLAIGTITQNPKEFNVNAEALIFD